MTKLAESPECQGWTLDDVCREAKGAEFLNALHACNPNHPWNKTAIMPWTNAAFMAGGHPELSWRSHNLLNWFAAKERKPALSKAEGR